MNEDAYYLIEEYICDIAAKYYTNGKIPEDEEEELRESLVAVGVAFEYRDSYSDDEYVMDEILFIIDKNDMSIVEQGKYDLPSDVEDKTMEAAIEFAKKNY